MKTEKWCLISSGHFDYYRIEEEISGLMVAYIPVNSVDDFKAIQKDMSAIVDAHNRVVNSLNRR